MTANYPTCFACFCLEPNSKNGFAFKQLIGYHMVGRHWVASLETNEGCGCRGRETGKVAPPLRSPPPSGDTFDRGTFCSNVLTFPSSQATSLKQSTNKSTLDPIRDPLEFLYTWHPRLSKKAPQPSTKSFRPQKFPLHPQCCQERKEPCSDSKTHRRHAYDNR